MQVYVLCDDALSLPYQAEHGLSLFIKTNSHNILFDAGRSDAFAKNAALAGIDLSEIDTVVLSHGHYDHADGLMHFLQINNRAKIYVHAEAFGDFRHGERYIGADKRLQAYTDRMVLISEDLAIDDTLSVVTADGLQAPQTGLLKRIGNEVLADDFAHEIYLEVSDTSKKAFFTGCAHKGIVSIANLALRRGATHLIGGFHLTDTCDAGFLQEAANALADIPLVYYTGHCTSQKAYDCLKRTLQTRLHRLSDQAAFAIGDHAEVARFLFRQGYNCSQAVLGAFADELGLDGELAMRLSCSFGGGMGRMREVCGAVSGMLMVCGCTDGYSTPETGAVKAAHYKKVQELAAVFRERHGSLICRELLGGSVSNAPTPSARTEEFYRLRPCERLIASAASIAEEMLLQK